MVWQGIRKVPHKVIERAAKSKAPFARRISNRVQRKALFTTMSIILVAILSAIIVNSTSTITVANANSVRGVGVGIYWDQACTNRTLTVDWGQMEAGSNNTVTVYVRNEGHSAVTLGIATSHWIPSAASGYLNLSSTHPGKSLNANEVIPMELILTVFPTVNGITDFTFDLTITATE